MHLAQFGLFFHTSAKFCAYIFKLAISSKRRQGGRGGRRRWKTRKELEISNARYRTTRTDRRPTDRTCRHNTATDLGCSIPVPVPFNCGQQLVVSVLQGVNPLHQGIRLPLCCSSKTACAACNRGLCGFSVERFELGDLEKKEDGGG